MKQKPSKRTLKNRQDRKWLHDANNGWHNVITLGDINADTTLYVDDVNSVTWTFPEGTLITMDNVFDGFGTKVHYGKNPKKVHPARRNKEKKKTRTEALISSGGATATIVKIDSDTWTVTNSSGVTL